MPDREALTERVRQALELTAGDAELHAHTSWEVGELLTRVKPSDLTPAETMAMAVILAHAHARKLERPRPSLAVIPVGPAREHVVG